MGQTHLSDELDDLVVGGLRPLLDLITSYGDCYGILGANELPHAQKHVHAGMHMSVVQSHIHLEKICE